MSYIFAGAYSIANFVGACLSGKFCVHFLFLQVLLQISRSLPFTEIWECCVKNSPPREIQVSTISHPAKVFASFSSRFLRRTRGYSLSRNSGRGDSGASRDFEPPSRSRERSRKEIGQNLKRDGPKARRQWISVEVGEKKTGNPLQHAFDTTPL